MATAFSDILKQEITDFWQDKAFTYRSFEHLAKKHYKTLKSVSGTLKKLADSGKLKITNGATKTNIYMTIPGVPLFEQKVSKFCRWEWQRQQKNKEEQMLKCADRLNDVLDLITRNNAEVRGCPISKLEQGE